MVYSCVEILPIPLGTHTMVSSCVEVRAIPSWYMYIVTSQSGLCQLGTYVHIAASKSGLYQLGVCAGLLCTVRRSPGCAILACIYSCVEARAMPNWYVYIASSQSGLCQLGACIHGCVKVWAIRTMVYIYITIIYLADWRLAIGLIVNWDWGLAVCLCLF